MLAAYAAATDLDQPLRGLRVGQIEPPEVPQDWVEVQVRASALNHHDVWSLKGVGLPADRLPMVLGCDAAGVTSEGREVVVHAVLNEPGFAGADSTHDPHRSLLSERYPGTHATLVRVPAANLVDKPAGLSFVEAACLPTAWLTAYRMLFTQSGTRPGDTVLIQGAGGGVATAAVVLARHAGLRVWVTSRSAEKGERARALGAHAVFEAGARLAGRGGAGLGTGGGAAPAPPGHPPPPRGAPAIARATPG